MRPAENHPLACVCKGTGYALNDTFHILGGDRINLSDSVGEYGRVGVLSDELGHGGPAVRLHIQIVCRMAQDKEE